MSNIAKKVTIDLYTVQMKWVAWYLPIVYVLYFALVWFLKEPEIQEMSLLTFTFQTATIFMLVCGILSSTIFLPMFVKQGISRKSYFQGALFSSIALALTINGMSVLLTWIISLFNMTAFQNVELSSLGANSWALTTIAYIILVMLYFLVGWFIGSSFYRYGSSKGFIAIIIGLVAVTVNDLLWTFSTPKPFNGLLNMSLPTPPLAIAFIGSIVIATIATVLAHKVIKEMPIKVG